jgi:hypothetical protein
LKFFEERVENNGQQDRPKNGRQKRRKDLIKEIEREEGEKENEYEKDMFSFHWFLSVRIPEYQAISECISEYQAIRLQNFIPYLHRTGPHHFPGLLISLILVTGSPDKLSF